MESQAHMLMRSDWVVPVRDPALPEQSGVVPAVVERRREPLRFVPDEHHAEPGRNGAEGTRRVRDG